MQNIGQTGGAKKTWLFDPATAESIGVIRDALVHNDQYFFEDDGMTTLAIVMDRILDDLPEDIGEAVRLVHLEGRSYRAAGRILDVDHKTVKSRVEKGIAAMRKRLVDSVWVAEMLKGYLPADEVANIKLSGQNTVDKLIKTIGKDNDE